MKISVIITNWNGKKLLQKYLEKVIINSPEADEFILADDASTDDSLVFTKNLQQLYPKLKVISHQENQGFAKNSNFAVKKSIGDLVVLLNSDINPHLGYIKNSLLHFKDESVFGVGFAELDNKNYARIYWKNGYIQTEPGYSPKTHITAWLSGGSSIVRKDYFQKLGGFDTIYDPFYNEDQDLGMRAWRSGYKLLWEPKSIVEHRHESTTSKFPKLFLIYVKERNILLTTLRNITNQKMLLENKIWQFLRILSGPNYLKIILAAHRQLRSHPPQIVTPKLTDKQLLEMLK